MNSINHHHHHLVVIVATITLLLVVATLAPTVNARADRRSISECEYVYNVFSDYSVCIPRFSSLGVKKFDVCSETSEIDGAHVDAGFIHSPHYPDYYGNSRKCQIDLHVPANKRVVLYAVRVSLESLSVVHGQPNDYVRVSDGSGSLDFVYYGLHSLPKFIYEGTDRPLLHVNFRSDWITTQRLAAPKGFLIYFEFLPLALPSTTTVTSSTTVTTPTTTTAVSTTTSTTTSTPTTSTTPSTTTTTNMEMAGDPVISMDDSTLNSIEENGNMAVSSDELFDSFDSMKNNNDDVIQSISAKIENGRRESDHLIGILVVLVSIIGVLVLIIFGLLLMFRSKKRRECEEDTIYEAHDSKSMGSATIYADDYVSTSCVSSSSATSTMMRGTQPQNQQHASKASKNNSNNNNSNRLNQSSDSNCVQSSKAHYNGFNDRLKRLYRTLNKTLNISSHLIGSTIREVDRAVEKKLDNNDDDVETSASKTTSVTMDKSASRCMNEYSSVSGTGVVVAAECELKTENDSIVPNTPVSGLSDRLRLFRPHTPIGMRRLISSVAGENTYVASTPIQVSSGFVAGTGGGDSTLTAESPGQLNIYEVDFENDVAYIVPSVTTVPCSSVKSATECKDDAEIYHAINDLEMDENDVQELIKSTTNSSSSSRSSSSTTTSSDHVINENEKDAQNIDEMIYSTPSNKLIERNNDTSDDIGSSSSSGNNTSNDKNGNSNDSGDDRSVLRLVQHDDDSHDA